MYNFLVKGKRFQLSMRREISLSKTISILKVNLFSVQLIYSEMSDKILSRYFFLCFKSPDIMLLRTTSISQYHKHDYINVGNSRKNILCLKNRLRQVRSITTYEFFSPPDKIKATIWGCFYKIIFMLAFLDQPYCPLFLRLNCVYIYE